MFRLSRIALVLVGLLGGLVASQAPEFSQQYRQRLNGALDELSRIVARFDADAAAEGLDRDAALAAYDGVASSFLQRRGESVRLDLVRLESLSRHAADLETTDPLWRPLIVAREADKPLLRGTWGQYVPAVPIDVAGALYAGLGFLASVLAGVLGLRTLRIGRRPQPRPRLQPR